jgi:hypothetical protein
VIARSCSIASLFFLENLPVSGKKQQVIPVSSLEAIDGDTFPYHPARPKS